MSSCTLVWYGMVWYTVPVLLPYRYRTHNEYFQILNKIEKSHSTSLIAFCKKYAHSFYRIERIINISSKEMVSSGTNERPPRLLLNSTVPLRDPTKNTTEVPDSLTEFD